MMEASSSGKISSELMVHFLRNTGSIKNEREASPQRNNQFIQKYIFLLHYDLDLFNLFWLFILFDSPAKVNE